MTRCRSMMMMVAVLVSLLAAGCADTSGFDDATAGDGGAPDVVDDRCEGDETRCYLRSFQRCRDGLFVEAQACTEQEVCSPSLGCAACDPALGKGCRDNAIYTCNADGTLGERQEDCLGLTCEAGRCQNPRCAPGSKLVYVVDNEHRLFSFDPGAETDHFKLIATLDCPAGDDLTNPGQRAHPFSMSVDRGARAWVLYSSGEIFWVDTKTGACTPSPIERGQEGFVLFGMGFVADEAGSDKERLYVSTDRTHSVSPNRLAALDPATLALSPIGVLAAPEADSTAELSGTGNAELFAFFPGVNAGVAKVDKGDGAVLQSWPVPPVPDVRSWAFAHWGGNFYIFVTYQESLFAPESRKVLFLDPEAAQATTFLQTMPYRIVGAGVSTCAPVIR